MKRPHQTNYYLKRPEQFKTKINSIFCCTEKQLAFKIFGWQLLPYKRHFWLLIWAEERNDATIRSRNLQCLFSGKNVVRKILCLDISKLLTKLPTYVINNLFQTQSKRIHLCSSYVLTYFTYISKDCVLQNRHKHDSFFSLGFAQ